jgi:D-alanine-D-alanine ligase
MRVAFLYNRSSEDPAHAAEDEVPSRSPVVAAIKRLGHRALPIACKLDLAAVRRRVLRAKPDVVFNRVESLGGSDSMMAAIPLLLEASQIPYTGNSSAALTATSSKVFVKERLVRASLPTPQWVEPETGSSDQGIRRQLDIHASRYIIKSIYEHASFQMCDDSVVSVSSYNELQSLIRAREASTGRAHFAEAFIEGREFNLSLLGSGPQVLPPAEIDFSAFPPDRERIVGHGAKWNQASFEYHHTPRRFDFAASEEPLLRRLSELAVRCWTLFDLCGYARIDFRVDRAGQPWILEINTNPCISPDAGFAAALEQSEIGYDGGIGRILDDALARGKAVAIPAKDRPVPAKI